jgi:uncharacterized membrane protein YqiK
MDTFTILIIAVGVGIFILMLFILAVLKAFYHTVEQGHALIITRLRSGAEVSFSGAVVLPVVNRSEVMDISLKTIEVDRRGANGLICKDNIRADIKVTFFVRINKTAEDVMRVATSVGVHRASDQKTLEELFLAKFSEALKTVGKRMEFVDLYNQRDEFKDEIVKVIGRNLNGYALEDAAIDFIEQTPLTMLDPDNILDSEGRKKIIELTSLQKMKANEIERETQKKIKKQDVEAREAILSLERQQCEAEAKQQREIATVRARESAEQLRVEAEERKRATEAQIAVDQELGVQKQNADREVQIAGKNREGAVAVEGERVEKDRMLQAVARERAVELSNIEREKIIAEERKQIAEVIRDRIVVERAVAEEEERIKDVRLLADARRVRDAALIKADQQAQEIRIKEVSLAEAESLVAVQHAKERLTLAEADQTIAEKEAMAAIRRSEGKQAEAAAEGLAKVKVAQAETLVIAQRGEAEASAIEGKMLAEARGLSEKAGAMAKLSDATREHEEFRLRLQGDIEIAKAKLAMQGTIAENSAKVLAESLKNANVQIVGGEGQIFDRLVGAIGAGRSIDTTIGSSTALQSVLKEYLDGERSLPDDLKDLLGRMSSADVANLAAAKALTR